MTLVNAETGEVVAEFTPEEAREFTDRLNLAVGIAGEMVVEAWSRRIWTALDYTSWDAYCAHEVRFDLTRESKSALMVGLRKAGASLRAIGAATGVSPQTAMRELAGVPNGTPAAEVTGTDGKSYPARRPEVVHDVEVIEDEEPAPPPPPADPTKVTDAEIAAGDRRAAARLRQGLAGWDELSRFDRHLRRTHVLALLSDVECRRLRDIERTLHG